MMTVPLVRPPIHIPLDYRVRQIDHECYIGIRFYPSDIDPVSFEFMFKADNGLALIISLAPCTAWPSSEQCRQLDQFMGARCLAELRFDLAHSADADACFAALFELRQ